MNESVITCACCGSTPGSEGVTPHPEYSLWGWFLLAFGVTVVPKKVTYECKNGRKFAVETDPETLRRFA